MAQKHEWKRIGPIDEGGTVFSLCVATSETKDTLWATTGTVPFRSDDGGGNWYPIRKGLRGFQLITLGYGPPSVLIAGDLNGRIVRSLDGGRQWLPEEPTDRDYPITCVAFSPNFERDGVILLGTDGDGIWRSQDDGRHWTEVNFGLWDLTTLALACAPEWGRREYVFAGTTDGVYRSHNGGRAWKAANADLEGMAASALAISPNFSEDRTVYAGTEESGIYRSTDAGETWVHVSEGLTDLGVNALWTSPRFATDRTLAAGTANGVFHSDDGGQRWAQVAEDFPPVLCLAGSVNGVYAGLVNAGVFHSTDRGKSWEPATQGLAARNYVRLVPCGTKTLFALGTEEGLLRSDDGGKSWGPVPVPGDYLPLTAIEASIMADGQVQLVAGSYEEGIIRSVDDGATWEHADQATHVRSVLLSPDFQRDHLAWAGADDGRLLVSSDGGRTWARKRMPFGGEQVVRLVASPHFAKDGTLFAGTFRSAGEGYGSSIRIWRSTDRGTRWHLYLEQEAQNPWLAIALPPAPSSRPYNVGIFGIGSRISRPSGSHRLKETLSPEEPAILELVSIPRGEKSFDLYAATNVGVFLSKDGGKRWDSFSEGLPEEPILSLIPSPSYEQDHLLYALSVGSVLWHRDVS